jgi:hypothetical protein
MATLLTPLGYTWVEISTGVVLSLSKGSIQRFIET